MEEKKFNNDIVEQEEQKEFVAPVAGRKKRSKKRLLLLLLLLLMTGIMLSTSTYAWFTSNRTVTVDDIDVEVSVGGGLQLSVDGTSWKSIITGDDISSAINTYSAATNQMPSIMTPVSTAAKSLNNGYLSMWKGDIETSETTTNLGEYILTTTDVSTVTDSSVEEPGANTGKNGHFVMFDLFVRLDEKGDANVPIYLTKSSDVIVTDGAADLGTQNSARVAFINQGSVANGSSLTDIQGLVTTDVSKVQIWEPNFDAHTDTGIANAYTYYNSSENGDAYNKAVAKSQLTYYGVTSKIETANDIILSNANETNGKVGGSAAFGAVTPGLKTSKGWATETAYLKLLDLTPQTITKLRVYFWVEGQDVDNENNASGGSITLKLSFSLNDKDATNA